MVRGILNIGEPARPAFPHDADQRIPIIPPSGRSVDNPRDVLRKVTSVTTTAAVEISILADNPGCLPFDPLAGFACGNGTFFRREHDLDNRRIAQTAGTMQHLSNGYEAFDNVIGIPNAHHSWPGQCVGYDAFVRLLRASQARGAWTHTYDAGSRLGADRKGCWGLRETRDSLVNVGTVSGVILETGLNFKASFAGNPMTF